MISSNFNLTSICSQNSSDNLYIDVDLNAKDYNGIGTDLDVYFNQINGALSNSAIYISGWTEETKSVVLLILYQQMTNVLSIYDNVGKYAQYLSLPDAWENLTVQSTGPLTIPVNLEETLNINEVEELGQEHIWFASIEKFYNNLNVLLPFVYTYDQNESVEYVQRQEANFDTCKQLLSNYEDIDEILMNRLTDKNFKKLKTKYKLADDDIFTLKHCFNDVEDVTSRRHYTNLPVADVYTKYIYFKLGLKFNDDQFNISEVINNILRASENLDD